MSDAKIFVIGSFVVASTVTVEALPHPGESLRGHAFLQEPGGKGFNLAIAARRLGASVDGLFAIGDDALSAFAAPAFAREGLSVSMLRHKTGVTGAGIGFIARGGETCLAVAPGANHALSAGDVREASPAIAAADVCLAQFEVEEAPIAEAFAIARAAGRLTILNPSPYRRPSDPLLALTSVLCVNAPEAEALVRDLLGDARDADGDRSERLAEVVFGFGVEALIVTSGAQGAHLYRSSAKPHRQAAFPVEAVDTLGAGDAFAAGLAVGLAERRAWLEVMRIAAACGALTATKPGTFGALPDRRALEALLNA
ncbi:ribokinase [Hansschlegelia quercus]|uniref:Ribokinase n=1 Tax=Hansschlegelia quercus TaxID=2528245 RepID=A0A4Q9GK22_9HYPH|nr:ribokinase [Hansschlegelia quercus]TBN52407.1 ribokinase [Hansschlegelia quercus]